MWTVEELNSWIEKNGVAKECYSANTIDYVLVQKPDGWVGILESEGTGYTPLIEAYNMDLAKSWCEMREPITVPVSVIC